MNKRSKGGRGMQRSGDLRYADKEMGEDYARCKDLLGTGRMTLVLSDGSEALGKVRGKMYKRVWINRGDLVICERRTPTDTDDQDSTKAPDKYDVVHKFRVEEERLLQRYGEITRGLSVLRSAAYDDEDVDEGDTVVFADGDVDGI